MRWLTACVLVAVGCSSAAAISDADPEAKEAADGDARTGGGPTAPGEHPGGGGGSGAGGGGGGGGADGGDGADAATGGADGGSGGDGGAASPWKLPPASAPFDYQLGGAYTPPAGVQIVVRDRKASPASGLYNICYVNGFQVQPNEESFWLTNHPDLILRDGNGQPIIDADWNEMMIDVGTAKKRADVATIVGGWIKGCATAGYDAVEIDNLDSFSRSKGRLTENDAVATMALFSKAAHDNGLAIAQKNSAELVGRRAQMGTDFVVAEECNTYKECGTFTGAYGNQVFVVEYRQADFSAGCKAFPQLSIILRDLNLVTPGKPGYVYKRC